MSILFAGGARRSLILITSVIGTLFLSPTLPVASAQQDDKDVAIKLLEKKLELQQKEFDLKWKAIELTLKQQQLEQDRLKEEIDLLGKTVKEREILIIKLEADLKQARVKGAEFKAIARPRPITNEMLLEQIRELQADLARLDAKGEKPGVEPPLKAVEANPPAAALTGKIEKVDGTLVQINLGTDNGLKENNTLHVYRLAPEPKYLGMIRIVDARHQQSIGRIIHAGKVEDRPMLKEGDQVTSHLKAKEDKKGEANVIDLSLDAAKPNPPPVQVNGKISKVDSAQLEITLGKDHSLQVNHTLDVFRLQPAPKYLGMMRIVRVADTTAVGRMIGANPPALKEGDMVTSKIK